MWAQTRPCLRAHRILFASRYNYWAVKEDQILMLFVFAKNEQDDLLPNQLRILRKLIEDEYP